MPGVGTFCQQDLACLGMTEVVTPTSLLIKRLRSTHQKKREDVTLTPDPLPLQKTTHPHSVPQLSTDVSPDHYV